MEERRNLSSDFPPTEEEFSSKQEFHKPTASTSQASPCKGDLTTALQDDEVSDEDEYCSAEEDIGADESKCSTSAKQLINSAPIEFEARKDDIRSATELTQKQNFQNQNDLAVQAQIEELQLMNDRENDTPIVPKMQITIPPTQMPLSHLASANVSSEEAQSTTAPTLSEKQNEHDHYYLSLTAQLEERILIHGSENDTTILPQMELSASTINVPSATVPLSHLQLSENLVSEQSQMSLEPYMAISWEPTTSTTIPSVLSSMPSTIPSTSAAPEIPMVHRPLQANELTENVPSVPGPEDQEMQLALYQQNVAFDLYCQHMNNGLEENALPHNVEDLHEINFDKTMQSYESCTRGLRDDAVNIGREILVENLEKCLHQLREDAQNQLTISKMSMSENMMNIYSDMILRCEMQLYEMTNDVGNIGKLEETYASTMDEILNTFDLITTDMSEDTNLPRRLLLSEMSSCFKNYKAEMCIKLLSNAEKNAMSTFQLLYTTDRDIVVGDVCKSMLEEIAQSAMTTALTGFEKCISDLNSAVVNQFRCRLKNEIMSASRKLIESHVVEERSRICQSHQHNLANPDLNTEENLILQHSEALAAGISSFRQRTLGFPTHLVNSECFLLQQEMEKELNDRLLRLIQFLETKKLNIAKNEAREMYCVVFELDENSLGNEEVGTLAMELSALRGRHEEALGVALASFDRLTRDLDARTIGPARNELQEEFQLKLNNSLKRTEDRVNVSQFEVAATEARGLYLSMFSDGNSGNVTVNVTSRNVSENEDLESTDDFTFESVGWEEDSDELEMFIPAEFFENSPESTIDISETNAAAPANTSDSTINQLESLHVRALSSALDLYNQLTAHHRETDITLRRAQLIESLENVYREAITYQRNQQLDMAENSALEKFTADLNVAARDSDTFARRQEEVRESVLQQFDQETSCFGSAAASHRERLLRAMNSSLNVIQSVNEFVGGSRECCICLTERCNTAFQPCGHMCCSTCAPQLSQCPTCRSPISGTLRIY